MSVPTASENHSEPVEAAIERHFKHNFIVNALDGGTFWFGYSFIAPTIILPLFISRLTDNPFYIGLIPFINTAFILVPQLFVSNWVSRRPVKKWFPVTLGFFTERVPIFLLPLVPLLFAKDQPAVALWLTLLLYSWNCLGTGLVIVGWQDMIGKIIPVDRRGRFFGVTNFAGTASGIAGAAAVAWVLTFAFPMGYTLAFTAAAVLIFASWLFLMQTREPAVAPTRAPVPLGDYLRSLPAVLRQDPNFSRFLLAQVVNAVSGMAVGFLVVYSSQRWGLSDSMAGSYNIALLVGQTLANLGLGWLADKRGHKLVIELGTLANAATFVLALLAPAPTWFYGIFFLRGVTTATQLMSNISLPLEFSGPEDRPTYIGLASTIPGLASSLAPLLAGAFAAYTGYPLLFGLSALISVLALGLMRFGVREPRFEAR